MIIHPVGAELFHADGRTDGQMTYMTKLVVTFRNFANAPKNLPSFLFYRTRELCTKPPKVLTCSSLCKWLLFLSASRYMEVKLYMNSKSHSHALDHRSNMQRSKVKNFIYMYYLKI